MLNSAERVSLFILTSLARQIGIAAPDLASLRSLYRRRKILHAHQQWAATHAGFRELSPGALRRLSAHAIHEASETPNNLELIRKAAIWCRQGRWILPGRRALIDIIREVRGRHELRLLSQIEAALPRSTINGWVSALTRKSGRRSISVLEDLRKTHRGRTTAALEKQLKKISLLNELGADRLNLPGFNIATLEHYAARIAVRAPRKLDRIREPRRTIELDCFLRLRLLRLSDQAADMADHRIANLWGKAHLEAASTDRALLARHQRFYKDVDHLAARSDVSDDDLGAYVRRQLGRLGHGMALNRTARARMALSERGDELHRVAKCIGAMTLEHDAAPVLDVVMAHVARRDEKSALQLLDVVGKKWREGLAPDDHSQIVRTASAAGAVILKRMLKNGSIGVVHSIEHRSPETRLIPQNQWESGRTRYVGSLGVTKNAGTFIKRIKPALQNGLDNLASAVRHGKLTIKDGRLVIPRLVVAENDADVGATRARLFDTIGGIQLPDVLVAVDAATGFTGEALGRPARSDRELITVYASLLALGSDLTAASAARMVVGVEPKAVARMMARLVASGTLPAANKAVLEFTGNHNITKLWGPGTTASSDMMSLEASRHLWSTRVDPRRRSYSIGAYTHVLDQWSIIYDQPIVLNKRQAGAAIEGALRQTVTTVDRLAVDTHGHTHFAMALAKCCGFDLCPRLAGLANRKLYLPRGFNVPSELKDIVSTSISTRTIANGWDELLRLASSVQQEWVPATFAMDRFGSAAKGDPIYEAGVGLGKLLLTLYLCDYLTKHDFQREVGRLLSQGESIHILQRAIHSKPLGAKTGRDIEELTAVSNALTLLTNIIVAWNTASMDEMIKLAPENWPEEHLRHIAPIAYAHINLRGVMTFDLEKHRDDIFGGGQSKNTRSKIAVYNL